MMSSMNAMAAPTAMRQATVTPSGGRGSPNLAVTACPGLARMSANTSSTQLKVHMSAPTATRTRDPLLRRQVLYPLSYRGLTGP